METRSIIQTVKTLGGLISKNSPMILTAMSVGGLITTAIFAGGAMPRALQNMEEFKVERCSDCMSKRGSKECINCADYDLTKGEIVRVTWKCFIPTAAVALVSIACIIGANHISSMRNAALASLYGLTEAAFKEYQSKVVETIGQNKELKVRDEISADRVRNNPLGSNEVIFTGKGDVMCYDSLSGRYFKSNVEAIRQKVNSLNQDLLTEMFMTVNELYEALGLSGTKLGDEMGWDLDKGLLEISFSGTLTEDGEPCLVLNYDVTPRFMPGR